jgi:hypothetical protein
MVLRQLRLWADMWRVRQFWKLRLALSALALAALVWTYSAGLTNRTAFYVFMAAVLLPIVVDLAFSRSDARRERQRTAPKFDVYTGEPLTPGQEPPTR